ncbi:GYDIA family GHMP kinase [Arenibacter latericius]|uniref:GYDIA family GHMP kinase n=1 Tax=Arenibacter latericius TaxID=86104 RepID=UPI0003FAEFFA|nr:GYDIA family GHMP kinase [Arenibacter latericius]MDX1363730.1 GYDIA family GHMP kinase [Arenibacter latericius]
MTTSFYSNGKLLISGEYLVLDGALSLAVPTVYGQSLSIKTVPGRQLIWKSLDEKGKVWFQEIYDLNTSESTIIKATTTAENTNLPEDTEKVSSTLRSILNEAKKINPLFLQGEEGYEVTSALNFPRDWGLGSSSTLINNIAQWANVDAYTLLWNAFSGSGYDIACAQHNSPITYQLKDKNPIVKEVAFNPSFKNDLYFIHLNKKQNSRDGIATYRSKNIDLFKELPKINSITQRIITSTKRKQFEKLIDKHEAILSEILDIPTVKEQLFPDFKGAIKSLGAWGGDFILAAGNKNTASYFRDKGYNTIIPYSKMVR